MRVVVVLLVVLVLVLVLVLVAREVVAREGRAGIDQCH